MNKKSSMKNTKKHGFKKELIKPDGSTQIFEYKQEKGTKSINQQMTEDPDKFINEWEEKSTDIITDNFEEKLLTHKGKYVKYTILRDGKKLLRNGGVILKVEPQYVMIMNYMTKLSWSVQYKNLVAIYIMKNDKKKKDNDEPEKEDKKKDKKKPDKKEDKKKPDKKEDKPDTDKILNDYYYQKNMNSRDKLYKALQKDGYKITRKTVEEWIKKNKDKKPSLKTKKFINNLVSKSGQLWIIHIININDKYILNCIDLYSKELYAKILRYKSSKEIITNLKKIFKENEKPSYIVNNSDEVFRTPKIYDFYKKENIDNLYGDTYKLIKDKIETINNEYKKYNSKTLTAPILKRLVKSYNKSLKDMN